MKLRLITTVQLFPSENSLLSQVSQPKQLLIMFDHNFFFFHLSSLIHASHLWLARTSGGFTTREPVTWRTFGKSFAMVRHMCPQTIDRCIHFCSCERLELMILRLNLTQESWALILNQFSILVQLFMGTSATKKSFEWSSDAWRAASSDNYTFDVNSRSHAIR